MADWYVSSVAYAAVPAWQANTAYTVGQIVRPVAAAADRRYPQRCTVAGTTAAGEPAWSLGNNQTTASGGATFACVGGQSAYGWGAAAGTLYSMGNSSPQNRPVAGDRVFVSSDHAETTNAQTSYDFGGAASFGLIHLMSVNRAGSVPPVAADLQNGASVAVTLSNLILEARTPVCWQGFTLTLGGTASASIYFNNALNKTFLFKNCTFLISNINTASRMWSNNGAKVILDNTPIQFGDPGQMLTGNGYPIDFTWINTPAALPGATPPATLFSSGSNSGLLFTCRGVDLSAVVGTLFQSIATGFGRVLLDSCRVAPGVTRFAAPAANATAGDEIELVNCFDGTGVVNERHTAAGDVTTDRSTVLVGGAEDDAGPYSHKMVASSRADGVVMPLHSFQLDVGNIAVGAPRTATVEMVVSGQLNNNDVRLLLEYMGTSGSTFASFADSLATPLTPVAALPASLATWNNPPATVAPSWSPADQVGMTFSNGNLTVTATSTASGARLNLGFPNSAGKYYWECTMTTWTGAGTGVGICSSTVTISLPPSNSTNVAEILLTGGNFWINGVNAGSLGTRASGDIIGIAVDLAADLIWFRVCPSGNWNNSGTANPATGVGGFSITGVPGARFPFAGAQAINDRITGNFGAAGYSGAAPAGFVNIPSVAPILCKLQATFTPQAVGRVRGLVRLGKPVATAWVNPQVIIT